jgi:hypothetical protein
MRRRSVNILRRTCWRNGNNFFAASRCRTSASAISRFTRLLSCPCGRWSRHLFLFLFGCSFFLRKIRRSFCQVLPAQRRASHQPLVRRRFHLKDKLRRHIVMQLDGDLVLAGVFDRRSRTILCRSISAPTSFFSRFTMSCAVTDPNALPVSPVSNVKQTAPCRCGAPVPEPRSTRVLRVQRAFA